MKSRSILLVSLALLSTLVTFCLFLVSKPKQIKNGFIRTINENGLTPLYTVNLKSNALYFAGSQNGHLFLGKSNAPFQLLKVNGKSQQIIAITGNSESVSESKIRIDSPYFYVSDLLAYKIYRGHTSNWRISETLHPERFFTEFIPVDENAIVQRTFKSNAHEYTLLKEYISSGKQIESPLLEKQIDGLFCTDGILQYDPTRQTIVYTYFYRNQFICTDTNLDLFYRARTIDTTMHARIKVSAISAGGSALSTPPHVVNRRSVVSEGKLYINSNLIADNENKSEFNTVDAIDVYSLSGGIYLHSFYIPRLDDQRLRHFTIIHDTLYTLHDRLLSSYLLPLDNHQLD